MEGEAASIAQEGRASLTNRLTREGRWAEASAFKDGVIKELRANGMARREAQEEAWKRMAAEYPPSSSSNQSEPMDPVDLQFVNELPDSTPTAFLQDATWVYNNLARADVKFETAPTSGSVGLLRWARRNEDDFFKQVWPKALALVDKQKPTVDDEVERNLAHVRSLEEMLYGPNWDPSKG